MFKMKTVRYLPMFFHASGFIYFYVYVVLSLLFSVNMLYKFSLCCHTVYFFLVTDY